MFYLVSDNIWYYWLINISLINPSLLSFAKSKIYITHSRSIRVSAKLFFKDWKEMHEELMSVLLLIYCKVYGLLVILKGLDCMMLCLDVKFFIRWGILTLIRISQERSYPTSHLCKWMEKEQRKKVSNKVEIARSQSFEMET